MQVCLFYYPVLRAMAGLKPVMKCISQSGHIFGAKYGECGACGLKTGAENPPLIFSGD